MGIIVWIVLGLVAGFIASLLVNKQGEGFIGDIVLGVVGALVGGGIARMLGIQGVNNLNIYSILIATAGAVLCLIIYHAVRGSHGRPVT